MWLATWHYIECVCMCVLYVCSHRIPGPKKPGGYFKQDSTNRCLDSLGGSKGGRVSLYTCHGGGGNQVRSRQIRQADVEGGISLGA